MWRWRLSDQHHKWTLLCVAVGTSILMHSFAAYLLLGVCNREVIRFSLSIKRNDDAGVPVIFAPLREPFKQSLVPVSIPQQKNQGDNTRIASTVIPPAPKPCQEKSAIKVPVPTKTEEVKPQKTVMPLQRKGDIKKSLPSATPLHTDKRGDMTTAQYAALQEELTRCWRAPRGVEGACGCELEAIIARDGSVQTVAVKRSSGVLMFDIAARSALLSMKLPAWTRGKSLVITFNQ